MKYDCLVIGGGVSGMTAAAIMAKKGRHTALLEASPTIAPTIRGFKRKGLFFDTGFHYTGGMNEGGALDIFFRYLGLTDRIETYPFDENGFDVFRCSEPDFEFPFPYGYRRIMGGLAELFPWEIEAVDIYLEAVKRIYHSQPYINLDIDDNGPTLSMADGPSLKEFLDGITGNEMLKCILSMHCLLHGALPGEVSLTAHASVVGSYYESVHGIRGGGLGLSDAYSGSLRELGVDVYCGSEVKEVLLSEGNAISGIRCDNGEIFSCDCCIATIHPRQLLTLLPSTVFRPAYRKRLELLEDTCSAILAYAGSNRSLESLGKSNLLLFPVPRLPDGFGPESMEERPMFVTLARQDGSSDEGCVIICPEPHTGTEYFKTSFPLDDPAAYRSYKADRLKSIIARLEATSPEFRGALTVVDGATPLTLKRYTRSPTGAIYGVKHRVGQYNPLPATKIKGLFLAGQAIAAPGILGAVVSGFLACGTILGHRELREELKACK